MQQDNNDDLVSGLLQIDQTCHQFQKLKSESHQSVHATGISVGVNRGRCDGNLTESLSYT